MENLVIRFRQQSEAEWHSANEILQPGRSSYPEFALLAFSLDHRWGGGGGSNFPYILLNEIQTMFSQLAKQSSRQ